MVCLLDDPALAFCESIAGIRYPGVWLCSAGRVSASMYVDLRTYCEVFNKIGVVEGGE